MVDVVVDADHQYIAISAIWTLATPVSYKKVIFAR
jgi:hypothetical protein